MSTPPPPWTCQLRAVVVPALLRTPGRGASGLRAGGFAVVDYADTPVGPYREALTAVALSARAGWVPWMVVDSPTSREGGREHWGLPKELATIDAAWSAAGDLVAGRVLVDGTDVRVRSRTAGQVHGGLPVRLGAQLRQPGRGAAPVRFTGRVRPAVVVLDGEPPEGVRPGRRVGVALEGEMWIGAPLVSDGRQ